MNTSATSITRSARLRVRLAGGAAGLAIAGVILTACSATSAGAVKPATSAGQGQYRQAVYGIQAPKHVSEQEQLRAEHRIAAAPKLGGTPVDDSAALRLEHLVR